MQTCWSSFLFSRSIFLYFFFFFVCSDTLFASYYRISPEGSESDNAGVVFIWTDRKLDAVWLLENAHLNVQEVSLNTIEASDVPYFIFNGGIGHRGFNMAQYSSHFVSAIRAVLLVMSDSRFHPPARSVASEPPGEDQRDVFIAVDQVDQLPWLLNAVRRLADRLQRRGRITGWYFMRLIFLDEGRVAVRIRVSSENSSNSSVVLWHFRNAFPFRSMRYRRATAPSGEPDYLSALESDPARNAFDVSGVDAQTVFIVRNLLMSCHLLIYRSWVWEEEEFDPEKYDAHSFLVRFNIEQSAFKSRLWLKNIENFLNYFCGEYPQVNWYLARMERGGHTGDNSILVLTFRFIVYTDDKKQEPVDPDAFSGWDGVSEVRSWNSLQIPWRYPDRQAAVQPAAVQPAAVQPAAVQPAAVQLAAVQPSLFARIFSGVLRLFRRRNHAENGNPAEPFQLLTNPNGGISHMHLTQCPGSSRMN